MSVNQTRSFDLEYSVRELKKNDPNLIKLFDSIEVNTLDPGNNYFKALTRSIIYQQLSGRAAKTIFNRFKSLYSNNPFPIPEQVLETDIETLRASGLSYNKSYYIKNIAQAFLEEPDAYDNLSKMNDKDIIGLLTQVKGIGLWTVQMFLMFTLNRPDVFPATDLAIQKGYRSYFKLNDLPKPNDMIKRSEMWIPYRTTVSLYLWSVLEGPFEW
jgi:3-methyladenine DNA glycosylase/8-oxoguanine DNA glycosylase